MLSQHLVDARLPSWSGCSETLNDVRIKPEAHQVLRRFHARPATQAAFDIGGIGGGCWSHPSEMAFVERQSVRIGECRRGDGLVFIVSHGIE
jgi:hypothetical protein